MNRARVLGTAIHSDGRMSDLLCIPGGGSRRPANDPSIIDERLPFIKMKGNETFKVAVCSLSRVSNEVLDRCGLSYEEVRWLVPHQANLRIIEALGIRW